MTYISAAETVLRRAKHPMTVREITTHAINNGLIRPQGRTPEATMSAALYRIAKQHPDIPIRREYEPGQRRAQRDSVRWIYGD